MQSEPGDLSEERKFLTAQELIAKAVAAGVDFGHGKPLERLRYLVKLGLLPHPERVLDKSQKLGHKVPPRFIGVYPKEALAKLTRVHKLIRAGKSLAHVKEIFEKSEVVAGSLRGRPPVKRPVGDTEDYLLITSKPVIAPVLARFLLGGIAVLVITFALVVATLAVGGGKARQFLQVPGASSYNNPSSVTANDLPAGKAGVKQSQQEIAASSFDELKTPRNDNQDVLAAKTSSLSLIDQIYGASSDFFSTILKPFVNLAEVMMNGSKTEINYAFNVPSKAQVTNAERLTTNASYLPLAADGSINVDGQATFNSLLKAASLSAGALSVSGSTT
ncbi:MAG: hypothetical protein Q7S45_00005, partial [Candidatus Curtissbacteria bacterium]|nr:hypothetical protein [Candidatus Curtissbacteria bacterium]